MSCSRIILAGQVAVMLFAACGCDTSDTPTPTVGESSPQTSPASSVLTSEPTAAAQLPPELIIRPGIGVGDLEFGMTAEDRDRILGEPERTTGRACEYMSKGMAVVGSPNTAVAVLLFGDAQSAASPVTKACKYRTAEGIGIGSTPDEIVAAYGEPAASRKPDNNLEMLRYDRLNASFTLRDGKVVHMIFRQIRP